MKRRNITKEWAKMISVYAEVDYDWDTVDIHLRANPKSTKANRFVSIIKCMSRHSTNIGIRKLLDHWFQYRNFEYVAGDLCNILDYMQCHSGTAYIIKVNFIPKDGLEILRYVPVDKLDPEAVFDAIDERLDLEDDYHIGRVTCDRV